MTLKDTTAAISSPGSPDGISPCRSPDGVTAPSGPEAVHVSRLRAQDSGKAMPTVVQGGAQIRHPATVTRLKLRGDFTGNAASELIRQALIADGLWPEDGEAATVQCDLPIQNPVHMQSRRSGEGSAGLIHGNARASPRRRSPR